MALSGRKKFSSTLVGSLAGSENSPGLTGEKHTRFIELAHGSQENKDPKKGPELAAFIEVRHGNYKCVKN